MTKAISRFDSLKRELVQLLDVGKLIDQEKDLAIETPENEK